jgi:hypothetical protein
MKRPLLVEGQRGIRAIVGRVAVSGGTPSVGAGAGFSVVDVAPGQVKVVIDKPGKEILYAKAFPIEGTDATGHFAKVDAKTEASDVTFGVYKAGGAAAAISASNVDALSASNVTLDTSNTYSDAALITAIDSAVDALAAKVKTAVDAGVDAAAAKVVTQLDLQDGILADNVGFFFEILVRDV